LTTLGDGAGGEGLPAESSQPFGQHYDGLEQRRVAVGVSTMAAPSANSTRTRTWRYGSTAAA
jgi:hypothetical protein